MFKNLLTQTLPFSVYLFVNIFRRIIEAINYESVNRFIVSVIRLNVINKNFNFHLKMKRNQKNKFSIRCSDLQHKLFLPQSSLSY